MFKRTRIYDANYYKFIGTWAWIIHRLSGLALIFYLTLHIWVVNTLTMGPDKFNEIMTFLSTPMFKYLEVGLWGVILFHAFNGIRVVVVDFFRGSLFQKKLFFILMFIAVMLWITGSYLLLSHINVN